MILKFILTAPQNNADRSNFHLRHSNFFNSVCRYLKWNSLCENRYLKIQYIPNYITTTIPPLLLLTSSYNFHIQLEMLQHEEPRTTLANGGDLRRKALLERGLCFYRRYVERDLWRSLYRASSFFYYHGLPYTVCVTRFIRLCISDHCLIIR